MDFLTKVVFKCLGMFLKLHGAKIGINFTVKKRKLINFIKVKPHDFLGLMIASRKLMLFAYEAKKGYLTEHWMMWTHATFQQID